MKLKQKLICLQLLFTLVISGCGNSNEKRIDWQQANIAVIESASFETPSYINFYDLTGKKLYETSYDCVQTIGSFEKPIVYKDKIYATSLGGNLESKKVVEFDLSENKCNLYDIYTGIFTVAANDDYIFASYSPAKGSVINKFNKSKKIIEGTLNIDGLVKHLQYFNNLLFAFTDSDDSGTGSFITVIDPATLKIKSTISDKLNSLVFDSINIDNFIFYTHQTKNDYQTPSRVLSKLNTQDYSIYNIELQEDLPYQIKQYKDNLYITHFDAVLMKGTKVTKYNLKTQEKTLIPLDLNLNQIEIKADKLYATDLNNMYIYDLNNFNLIKKFQIEPSRKKYRISGFFIVK